MTNAISEIHSDLIKIGLTEKEAKLYVGALQTSTFSLAEISKLSGIKRPTCYLIIENLLKKSLIARVPDSRSARYIIVEPHIVLEREKEKLKETEKMVKLMAQIRSKEDRQEAPHIQLYHGVEGVKQIFSTIIEDRPKTVYSMIDYTYFRKYIGEAFFNDFKAKRLKLGIERVSLQKKSDYESGKNAKLSNIKDLRRIRFLPNDVSFESMLYVWGNKVAFVSDKKEGISFIVSSQEYVSVILALFNLAWNSMDSDI